MPLLSKKAFHSTAFVFAAYVIFGCLAVLVFRGIFPGEAPPLPIMARSWRMNRVLLDIIALFPALAFAALALSFGMDRFRGEGHSSGFSADLLKNRFKVPIITAISAAAFYALLFFMILPLAQGHERNMRFEGKIFRMASDRALAHGEAGEWVEASQFIAISESVWPGSPGLYDLRIDVDVELDRLRFARRDAVPAPARPPATLFDLPGHWDPVTTVEAMALSRAAYAEGRMFDAHWLATLGSRLAPANSPDSIAAAQFAARAWNQIETLRPTEAQLRAHRLFQLKVSGYQAMLSGDWIQAFYIFSELSELDPGDPDVRNFLALSEREIAGLAFFVDEMNVAIGDTIAGALFSLPVEIGAWRGRAVLRLASLSAASNVAFGVGLEYMLFDQQSRLMLHLHSPYAKFVPFMVDGYEARHQVLVMMRALDRNDPEGRWEPSVEFAAEGVAPPPSAQFLLNVSYDAFLMLSHMRQDVSGMHIAELFDATGVSAETGHIPQVFEAEILNRLGSALFFLPMSIVAIAIGWYFRARRFPRFLFVPMLFVMPLVFNAVAYIIRAGLNVMGISLTLALGFPAALILFSLILAFAFVCSLLLLAAQKG